jgi:hypothetical protein
MRVLTSGSACVTHGWGGDGDDPGRTSRHRCPGETADPDVGDVAFTKTVRDPGRSTVGDGCPDAVRRGGGRLRPPRFRVRARGGRPCVRIGQRIVESTQDQECLLRWGELRGLEPLTPTLPGRVDHVRSGSLRSRKPLHLRLEQSRTCTHNREQRYCNRNCNQKRGVLSEAHELREGFSPHQPCPRRRRRLASAWTAAPRTPASPGEPAARQGGAIKNSFHNDGRWR